MLTDNKNITPASSEDIARAIAEAQHKLSSSQMEPLQQEREADNAMATEVKTHLSLKQIRTVDNIHDCWQ